MPRYYRSCNEIFVYNFYKIMESNDFRYLYLDYDEFSQEEFKDRLDNESEVWNKIYEEYLELTGDSTSIIYYQTCSDLLYLEGRYEAVNILLHQIVLGNMSKDMLKAYCLELKKLGYKIDYNKDINDELVKMFRQLKGSKNKIEIKREQKKQLENVSTEEKLTLIQQQIKIEQALSRNDIDTKKTVLAKWIGMIKEIELINKSRKKENGK